MKCVYAISEREGGRWCITLGKQLLRTQLCPGAAINLARRLAREHHHATGCPARVDFLGGTAPIVLAQYGMH